MPPAESPAPPRDRPILSLLLLVAGTAAVATAWIAIAAMAGAPASWMAAVAALDAAWLLRLSGMAPGPRRASWAVLATAAAIALATWGMVASGIGALIGLPPLASALKLGTGLALTVVQLMHGPLDFAMLAFALLLAALAGR